MDGNSRISDLTAIYAAIGSLQDARDIINARVRGTADPLYDWVRRVNITIADAQNAYKRLERP